MARILRGNRKGQECTLHQWANDWLSVDFADGTSGILKPLSIELDPHEQGRWARKPNGMDREYDLHHDGRFRRRSTDLAGGGDLIGGTVIGWVVVDHEGAGLFAEDTFTGPSAREDAEASAERNDPVIDGERAGRYTVAALVEPGD